MSLEYYQDREVWDFKDAFEDLVEKDIAAWKRLKVDLPRQFTHPSGSIKSALAIHLFNPTLYVEDVTCEETDDPTNPTIKLLHDSGLPTTECSTFDQILRRSRTLDCLDFYSDDLRRPLLQYDAATSSGPCYS